MQKQPLYLQELRLRTSDPPQTLQWQEPRALGWAGGTTHLLKLHKIYNFSLVLGRNYKFSPRPTCRKPNHDQMEGTHWIGLYLKDGVCLCVWCGGVGGVGVWNMNTNKKKTLVSSVNGIITLIEIFLYMQYISHKNAWNESNLL